MAILSDLENGSDGVEEFVEGEVVAIGDDALQVITEVLDVE